MECCTSIRMSKVVLCNYLDKTHKKNVEKKRSITKCKFCINPFISSPLLG